MVRTVSAADPDVAISIPGDRVRRVLDAIAEGKGCPDVIYNVGCSHIFLLLYQVNIYPDHQ